MKVRLLTRIAGPLVVPFALLIGCSSGIDDKGLTPVSGLTLKYELLCTISRSSNKEDVGKKITLIGLKGLTLKSYLRVAIDHL